MAKKRKPKNTDQIRDFFKRGGFSAFDKACRVFFTKLDWMKQYDSLSIHEKRYMFCNKLAIRRPVASGNQSIPTKELKKLGNCIQKKIRIACYKTKNGLYSPYEFQIFWLLGNLLKSNSLTEKRRKILTESFGSVMLNHESFVAPFLLAILKSALSLSSIDTKYYSIDISMAAIVPDNPRIELTVQLYLHPARKKHIKINNIYRPAFLIGLPNLNLGMDWLKIKASLLRGAYSGQKEELWVYVQSHARQRLNERLDLLDSSSIYYTMFQNIMDMDQFIFYKDYILFPIELHNCKVGYLVVDIIDDLVVFKTFLFITHSSTPEGDKLKEISGLSWKDISYWKIDRLSTFMKTDTEKYPGLTAMFEEAGLGDLFKLKNKEFDLDTLQDVNMDALRDYIAQGKQEVSMEFT